MIIIWGFAADLFVIISVFSDAKHSPKRPQSICDNVSVSQQSTDNSPAIDPQQADLPRGLPELNDAIAELKENYEKFAKHNKNYLLIEEDFHKAFEHADAEDNLPGAAQTFSDGIRSALRTIRVKQKYKENNWSTRVGSFLTKTYPVAKIALGVSSTAGEESPVRNYR
jgi:hypothetical protein